MEMDLKNKVVFVTGSARRVGRAVALGFARAGAHLIIHHSRSPEQAAEVAEDIRALGREALVVQGDHSHHEAILENFAAIKTHFGRLDMMVNSAGNFTGGDLLDIPAEEWQETVALNLSAPLWCTQEAGKMMRDAGQGGSIINIGDNAGLMGWAKRPHHSITKAGVVMLTTVTAKSLAKYNIRANCIIPGPVLAPDDMEASYWQQVIGRLPLQRSGEPDDVTRAALFIAQNDFITGAVLRIDGGEFLGL